MTVRDIVNSEEALLYYPDKYMDKGVCHYWVESGWLIVSFKDYKMLQKAVDKGITPEFLNKKPDIMFGDIYQTIYCELLPNIEEGRKMKVTDM
jgi:hypothetical protein